ncbi:hypothetical protein ACSQ67_005961 [Phaseolus vulgaris]
MKAVLYCPHSPSSVMIHNNGFAILSLYLWKVGSFDAGYGSSIMSRLVGPKKAREMWFLTRFYDAVEAEKMGLINTVVPLDNLEKETIKWCREILRNSPTAIRVLKSALNAVDDGHSGLQELGGNATLIYYGTEEAKEGRLHICNVGALIFLSSNGDLKCLSIVAINLRRGPLVYRAEA